MTTEVVNVKYESFDVYIGRANAHYGLKASPFANPFRIGVDGTREEVIAKYRGWILKQPALLRALPGLKGKRLGCWCRPLACHGDVLAELADGQP